jgi:hypothetical protein
MRWTRVQTDRHLSLRQLRGKQGTAGVPLGSKSVRRLRSDASPHTLTGARCAATWSASGGRLHQTEVGTRVFHVPSRERVKPNHVILSYLIPGIRSEAGGKGGGATNSTEWHHARATPRQSLIVRGCAAHRSLPERPQRVAARAACEPCPAPRACGGRSAAAAAVRSVSSRASCRLRRRRASAG